MAGKMTDGSTACPTVKESKAFCAGYLARTLSTTPTTPFVNGSDEDLAWDRGVAAKAGESGTDADKECCAPCGAKAT